MATRVITIAGLFGMPQAMNQMLGGSITNGNIVVPFTYNNFVSWDMWNTEVKQGASSLNAVVNSIYAANPADDIVMFGHSAGARVITNWAHMFAMTCTIPAARLRAVCIGNSERKYGGFVTAASSEIPVGNPYSIYDLAIQYDGWADFPTNRMNWNAALNAFSGMGDVHMEYKTARLGEVGNVSVTERNVIYEWKPNGLIPMRGRQHNAYADEEDHDLRPGIESAYSRPVSLPIPFP